MDTTDNEQFHGLGDAAGPRLCKRMYKKKYPLFVKVACGVFSLLALNLSGGIVGKYIALSSGLHALILVGVLFSTFGLRALAWMVMGKRFQLSYVYPFMSLNFVLAAFVGHLLFGEEVTGLRIAGSLFLVAGVTVLSTSPAMEDRQ